MINDDPNPAYPLDELQLTLQMTLNAEAVDSLTRQIDELAAFGRRAQRVLKQRQAEDYDDCLDV